MIPLRLWLQEFPEIRIAGPADSPGILELFDETPMKGKSVGISYDRGPDYFAFLRCHSPQALVLILLEGTKIQGTASYVIRPGIIKGERRWVGYLGDLRITNPRRWGRYWRNFYLRLMEDVTKIEEFKGVVHWQTCLLEDNPRARKALVESPVLGYRPYSRYRMVNLLGRWPVPGTGPVAVPARAEDLPEIRSFWRRQYLRRDFGYVFDEDFDELAFRLQSWPGVSLEDLLVVRDKNLQVIGATLLWNPTAVKKIMLRYLPPPIKLSGTFIRLLTPWPREGEELKCLYPTLLQVSDELPESERQRVAMSLLSAALKRRKNHRAHVVSVASFERETWGKALSTFINLNTNLELLTVDPHHRTDQDYTLKAAPGFEMALV